MVTAELEALYPRLREAVEGFDGSDGQRLDAIDAELEGLALLVAPASAEIIANAWR